MRRVQRAVRWMFGGDVERFEAALDWAEAAIFAVVGLLVMWLAAVYILTL